MEPTAIAKFRTSCKSIGSRAALKPLAFGLTLLTSSTANAFPVPSSPPNSIVVLVAVEDRPIAGPDFLTDFVRQSALISRIQDVLADLGIYTGPTNGELSSATERAIRIYESQVNLAITGRATRQLLDHLETVGRANKLVVKLGQTRDRNQETARQVLLASQVADRLKNEGDLPSADPLRAPSACFAAPTPGCLLDESFESAKAVADTKFRDWALGDVAVARAATGSTDAVYRTIRLIDDPRLVVASLRDAAIEWARLGKIVEAREVISGMPDPMFAAAILATIAETLAGNGDRDGVGLTLGELLVFATAGKRPVETAILLAGLAPKLYENGADVAGNDILRVAVDTTHDAALEPQDRDRAIGEVAAIYAKLGQSETARTLMARIGDPTLRRPVLMALAEKNMDIGEPLPALQDATDVEDSRYRVVALSYVAIAQVRAGNIDAARESVDRARADIDLIDPRFTYAKAFAVSRVAAALAEMQNYQDAANAAGEIEDGGLRAQSLWHLASVQAREGSPASAQTRMLARQAADSIKSDLDRSWTLSRLALSSADRGESELATTTFDAALSVAQEIKNSFARATALANLAKTLVQLDARRP